MQGDFVGLPMVKYLTTHWRLPVALATGLATVWLLRFTPAPDSGRLLIAWNIGALTYIGLVWRLFLTETETQVRARAAREDEHRGVILAIVLALIVASLAAIVTALRDAKHGSASERTFVATFGALTLITSWLLLQSVFVLHYAHRHFGDDDGDGIANGGFSFPGEPARTYLDFVYLSFCIGATFQVSDTTVNTARLRNLITTHAATAYFYNTAILALGINIIAGMVTG